MATVPNLGTGGSVLDAQFGSSPSPNTNEPLQLTHTGENYLFQPGANGNAASVESIAGYDIAGDLELVVDFALVDATAINMHFLTRDHSSGSLRIWYFTFGSTKTPQIVWFDSGGTVRVATSASAITLADNERITLKVTLDVDNGAGGNTVVFSRASSPTGTFTTISTVTQAFTTSIRTGQTVRIATGVSNSNTLAAPAAMQVYRAIVRNGIGGTAVLDMNFTTGITSGAQATFTESSSNAATVTINRSSSGRKSVAVVRPVFLLGTDDYFEVADNDLLDFGLTDSFTVWCVYSNWSTLVRNVGLVAKKQDTGTGNAGWVLYQLDSGPQATAMIGDGTNRPYVDGGNAGSAGVARMSAMVRDVAADNVIAYSRVGSASALTSDNTTATIANALAMRIGRFAGAGTAYADIELIAAGVHRRALSATELAQIAAYYGVA